MDTLKLSIDGINFFDIEGSIDVINKKIDFIISTNVLQKIFNINCAELAFNPDCFYNKAKNIFIIFNNIEFSCLNCIFSFNINDNIKFNSVSIDVILENIISDISNIKTKKVVFHSCYLGHSIHSAYINKYDFYLTPSINIKINTYTKDNFYIDIEVESKKGSDYEKLSNVAFSVIEMFMLLLGDIPIIDKIYTSDERDVIYHFELVDKYKTKVSRKNGKEILCYINDNTLNKENLKKFQKFRKDTKIIYDLFMININNDNYKEIKNCNLVQIMEGLYKTLIGDAKLHTILEYYFLHNSCTKKLLSRRDKRKVNNANKSMTFLYKANNHRNYLSHLNLNENKNVFYKLENTYAYWKLCMAIRIFILQYLNIPVDKSIIVKYNKEIDDWTKRYKLRFSSRLNKKI